MSQSLLFDDQFWHILHAIEKLTEDTSLADFQTMLGGDQSVSKAQVAKVVEYLQCLSYPVSIETQPQDHIIKVPCQKVRISMELSLSEWLAFQAHFPLMAKYSEQRFHHILAQKLQQVEHQYPQFDMFNYIDQAREVNEFKMGLEQEDLELRKKIGQVEGIINNLHMATLSLNDRSVDLYLHRLVYIDGELSLIGEDLQDRCLTALKLKSIQKIRVFNGSYQHNFSAVEIQDFISAMRSIGEKETRLVLKITSPEHVELNPSYHFLGRPYITSNLEGQLIWGATVELSDELFKWLYGIRNNIDILDPAEVKKQFELYCQEKGGPAKAISSQESHKSSEKNLKKAS